MTRLRGLTAIPLLVAWLSTACGITIAVPQDYPTIQAGVDAASPGDTVVVSCGVYHDCTHRDDFNSLNCVIMKSGVTLWSETGEADCVTLAPEGVGRGIYGRYLDSSTTIEGFTVEGGVEDHGGAMQFRDSELRVIRCIARSCLANTKGGGVTCWDSHVQFVGCIFENNTAPRFWGGGVHCTGRGASAAFDRCEFRGNSAYKGGGLEVSYRASATLDSCTFAGNSADLWGGAIRCWDGSSVELANCTLVENSGGTGGGGIGLRYGSSATLSNTIIAFSTDGPSFSSGEDSWATLACCDVYGNVGGDWVDCIADQAGLAGNLEADPVLCWDLNPAAPYTLQDGSPCAPGNSSGCGLIGAWPVGCAPTPVATATWGSIKARYR